MKHLMMTVSRSTLIAAGLGALRRVPTAAAMLVFAALAVTVSAQTPTSAQCLECHKDPTLTKDVNGKAVSVAVDETRFGASIHGSILQCVECHADVKGYPHEPAPKNVDCATCHSDQFAAWKTSRHGKAYVAGNHAAAGCLSCHGGNAHVILPSSDPASPTFHSRIPETCAACHAQKLVMDKGGLTTSPAFYYHQSVHGVAVAKDGKSKAAVCTDCHNSHDVKGANEADSTIFKFNIPATCGKCHSKVTEEYMTSVHGKAVARGNSKSPVCTDCHGIHNIKSHIDPTSSVAAQNLARTACGQCHGNVRLSKEFGVPSGRLRSYEESYHGLASRLGSAKAANCASCHGVHNILPASDPRSTINKRNLPATCGRCHPGAAAKFVQGRVHLEEMPVAQQELSDKVLGWVSRIYIPLIILTLGGMALHNLIIWVRKARRARKDPTRTVVRMNRIQRIQHFTLLTSFFALVITGFALAWPGSILGTITGGELVRRTIHRIAAVVMLVLGVLHVVYMVGTKEGRKGLKDFWFTFKDARDVIGVMKYYTGLSSEHPKMGRFTYAEKAEYWALVWGTIVMGVTGLMLWFEVQVASWLNLPRWYVDVALMIHFYEAILATLAIIIWHLYAVIFDPEVYPLNWAWFDGKMREGQFRHEHAEEWERMQRGDETKPPSEGPGHW